MRVLLVKTSSMGDVLHTLPALTDASKAIPGIQFDWVIEEPFAVIPTWHAAVRQVIPVALRRWRKAIFARETRQDIVALRKRLRDERYDFVLDAQSLVKSAFLTLLTNTTRVGLDFHSAREGFASWAYQRHCTVNFYQHAVVRMRQLFSQAFHYELPETPPDFGLVQQSFLQQKKQENSLVFLHGTTWGSKQWPENYWVQLAKMAAKAGYRIKISGGNQDEMERAVRIAHACTAVDVIPYLKINEMANVLMQAKAAIAVDTGFGHLSAALGIPTVSLYGSTNPQLTGALGPASTHLAADFACAPCLNRTCTYQGSSDVQPACYATVAPARVWDALIRLINKPHPSGSNALRS